MTPAEASGDVDQADPAVSGSALLGSALTFGRVLKGEGLAADLATVLDYVRALELVDIGDREEVRAAGEALFVRRREEIEPYRRAFAHFWRRSLKASPPERPQPGPDAHQSPPAGRPTATAPRATLQIQDTAATTTEAGGEERAEGLSASHLAYSAGERLRNRSFERMSAAELREAERIIDAMAVRMPLRRTRRWELHRGGTLLAPREMLRRNLATGGDPVTWLWRRRVQRPRSVVLLCDISGSMERHARLLLRFCHALARSEVPTEAFCFGTRLTRITPLLHRRDPNEALERISEAVGDWSGGTRIGGAFREFNQRWARRVLRSSGIVLVVSDGWDRGDPRDVGVETARLRRNCHRLIWLNPLAGSPDYRPLAAGMAAAYPHVDVFLPAQDLASLERLAAALGSDAGARPGVSLR